MQLAHPEQIPWNPIAVQRQTGKEAKTLLEGREGSPDNYTLVLVREGMVATTPRHKHNFDQLRMTISGRTNYGPKRWIEPGEIAYFPEGVSYGPEECEGNRVGFTLQFGGASRSGFMSRRQVKEGREALSRVGKFKRGVFYLNEGAANGRRTQDGYEAIWEYVNKRPLEYPKPRYDEPVLMRAPHFAWQDDAVCRGVQSKLLGVFTERRLEISMLRVEQGASAIVGPRAGVTLAWVLNGTGTIDGEAVGPFSAFEIPATRVAEISAGEQFELTIVGLPIF
jgi:hypothetical protein